MKARILVIGHDAAGQTVAALLHARLRLSWPEIVRLVRAGQIQLDGTPCFDPKRRLRAGQRMEVGRSSAGRSERAKPGKQTEYLSNRKRPHGLDIRIVFADAHLVVVDKPAGLTTVRHAHETAEFGKRARKFLPATLVDLLPELLAAKPAAPRGRLRAVHRLDKETSGLVVLARTPQAERHLGQQFRKHAIERRYLALVRGQAKAERIESYFVADRGDGRRGSSTSPGQGQRAVTHVQPLENLGEFTLVECRLETGRTHQVRIHLGERGTPLCGERIYDRPPKGQPLADASGAGRPALHAAYLAITHPATGARMKWTSSLPRDMRELLQRLRRWTTS